MKPVMKYVFLVAISLILSITTVVFGALPMRVLRKAYGRTPFWATYLAAAILLVVLGSPAYGLLVLALAMTSGIYTEIEENGGSVFISGFIALLAAVGVSAVAIGFSVYRSRTAFVETVREQITPVVERLSTMNPNTAITVDAVLQQLPSGLIIGLVIALAISLIGERRLLGWTGIRAPERSQEPASAALIGFRAPDLFVWLAIAAIFGSFVRHGSAVAEAVSLNVLNVLVVVFFFQGLAIVSHLFRSYRVNPFWQWLWYLVLVAQLFLLVSLVGFVDFWMDFRERLTRKPAETNKGL
jgi:hypothetical protein